MRALVFLLSALTPCGAYAAEPVSGSFSLIGGFVQMLASLAIVIGTLFVGGRLAKRFLSGGMAKKSVPRYIRVVESRFLAPKKSLMLVEVGGEYLLLGTTDSGITLLKQVDMLETVEIVEELSRTPKQTLAPSAVMRGVGELFQKLGTATPLGKRAI